MILFKKTTLSAFSFLLLLNACGGGGGGDDGDDPVVSAPENLNPCGTVSTAITDDFLDGRLDDSDCRVIDLVPSIDDTTFVDEFSITLTSTSTLTITMRSTDIDPFLILLNRSTSCSNGCSEAEAMIIAVDDDSGGGVNGFDASISMDLAAGTYIIWANSTETLQQTGDYQLEITF